MSTLTIVGNPKPKSRTFEAARMVIEQVTGSSPDLELDLTEFGAGLLDWSSREVAAAAPIPRRAPPLSTTGSTAASLPAMVGHWTSSIPPRAR